ncbi:MAG: Na(+)-translocating NADH-quinone reductase subunit C [Polyangiales bacterium]
MSDPDKAREGRTETVARTLLVALLVSLACSSLVASAAVLLRPRQVANAMLEARRNILEVAGLLEPGRDVDQLFESIEPRIVDLATGTYVEGIEPETYDPAEAAKDPARSVAVPTAIDVAHIGRRAKQALVYLVRRDGDVDRIILPVSGHGLWSTLHGFLAIEADGNTVADITFYDHGETPGLGDFISKPGWRSLWRDKRLFDESGDLRIEIVKGRVSADDPAGDYHVDGVSGATLTGNGVTNLMQYWLGDHGYGPYLRNLRRGEGT